ncbi:MAG: CHRD domain-containing protein [Candidatus Marinimicrobia bacterium]|nr:CHRD domain-containing protein [Candidatus Neomarinimicrobiota bacterium]
MKKLLLSMFIITILVASNLFAQKADRITSASLSGGNSVPPVTSSATGTFTGALTNDWTELHYSITIEGLTPTIAHFHNGAFDATGGVVKTLDFSNGMTISGVWSSSDGTQPFTTEMLNELLAGRIYVNIHTTDNPGGEIRGNIEIPVFFKAMLSGDKIVPDPITSPGVGTGGFLLFGYEREFGYALNVTGLTPTASHFHGGSATGTGGVLKTIDLVDDFAEGDWLGEDTQPLTDSLITELLLGNIYVNIHTTDNPGGEIRSQVEREDATSFFAFINGGNQVPSNASISSGFAVLTLNSAQTQVEYDITLSQLSADSLTAAHFHNAGAGISAGVVKTLDFVDGHASGVWSASDGSQPLTPELVEELLSGRLYVNVHTNAFPAGEIRGQVIVISGYNAQLSGSQSVPPVTSSGSGTFTSLFFYADSGAELEYNITVEGLTITAAHFHAGAAGVAGGVIKTITFDGNSAEGIWTADDAQPLTDDIVDMIRSGGVYVNIHTSANLGGEIRGQLLPGIIEVPIGVVDEDVAQLPTKFQLKQNYPNPFNPATSIEYSIPYEDKIVLTIYNILGEEVVRLIDETQPAGNYAITWDAANIASGIYFYKLQSGEISLTKKMLLLK